MLFRRCVTTLIGVLAFGLTLTASAATYTVVPGGNVTASVADFGSGVFVFDVRGISLVGTDPTGAFVLAEPPGGPAFGNDTLFALDLSFTESAAVFFDFTAPTFLGNNLVLPGNVVPITTLSDPGLVALSGDSPLFFGFAFQGTTSAGGAQISTFLLESITSDGTVVPEPGTSLMLAAGAVSLLVGRRLTRSKAA